MKKSIIFLIVFVIVVVVGIYGLCKLTTKLETGIYEKPGNCPICHEKLEKYCYGQYTPQFIYSCPNGCED